MFELTDTHVRLQAVQSLFDHLSEISEGMIVVDRHARIAWLDEKYKALLGVTDAAIGKVVEDVIPNSRLRQVIATGKPVVLDSMGFGNRSMVVVRLPLRNAAGEVDGAMGMVLYDRAEYIKPLFNKLFKPYEEPRPTQGDRRSRYGFSDFLGDSAAAREAQRRAARAAEFDTTVLLLGETGTGKELIAHAIHGASCRAGKPFVSINVAAIPENLLEAEFFGVAPGAYTGADRRGRDGKFTLADGGTVLLDEIGDMPLSLQTKLLRVLQEREVEPLGCNQVQRVDVRVIAATSRDLSERVRSGDFRADLYYRLNVIPIVLPPLRQRRQDITALANNFVASFRRENGRGPTEISDAAIARLKAHEWPGNVRELQNAVQQACAFCDREMLTPNDFETALPAPANTGVATLAAAVERAERAAIAEALATAGGNKTDAARLLGISRASFYERLKARALT
ncbi:MAG: sigma 54-interacting transcriptional regulator [Rhodospirillaceae bacterium]|nr:sigma 54-interacting transcriptional regulator [Rhodospirillales bacterium]